MAAPVAVAWGDQMEDDGARHVQAPSKKKDGRVDINQPLPETQTIVDNDVKKIISYSRTSKGEIEKKTRYFKVEVRKTSSNQVVLQRRKWSKFGIAEGLPPGPDASQTTITDDVYLVLRSKTELTDQPEVANPALASAAVKKCRHCGKDHWTVHCPYKDLLNTTEIKTEVVEEPTPSAGGVGSKYVPPHKLGNKERLGHSMDTQRDDATIRVTNLSENTQETDLRSLFSPFGNLSRVYLAKDRVTEQARGFAFISYYSRDDAQKAIDKLNGWGYDHLILQVEWSKQNH